MYMDFTEGINMLWSDQNDINENVWFLIGISLDMSS